MIDGVHMTSDSLIPYSRTLYDLLTEVADERGSALGVGTDAGEWSYGQLLDAASRSAGRLELMGVRRGDRLALWGANSFEWLALFFGATAIGAPVVALSTWLRDWDLQYVLTHSRARYLVGVDQFGEHNLAARLELQQEARPIDTLISSDKYPDLRGVVLFGGSSPRWSGFDAWVDGAEPTMRPASGVGPSAVDIAAILYTSGSTAHPKGVPLQHFALIENGYNIGERQGLSSADRVFLPAPLFWSYGLANALMATVTHQGALVTLARFAADKAIDLIERHECTSIYLLPNITRALLAASDDPSRVRSLAKGLSIGLPSDVRLAAESLGVQGICNIYGQTETYGNCCVTPWQAPLEVRVESQGPPLPGVEIRIVDEDGVALPDRSPGEIQVRGYVTPGYLSSEESSSAFADDAWYSTGDRGWIDDGGWLHFSGRLDDLIKSAGINVSPSEVEAFLATHPDVEESLVAGVPSPDRGQDVVAFVRLRDGATISVDGLAAYCREHISNFKVPRRFVLLASFPKTDTGKTSRRAVVQSFLASQKTGGDTE